MKNCRQIYCFPEWFGGSMRPHAVAAVRWLAFRLPELCFSLFAGHCGLYMFVPLECSLRCYYLSLRLVLPEGEDKIEACVPGSWSNAIALCRAGAG